MGFEWEVSIQRWFEVSDLSELYKTKQTNLTFARGPFSPSVKKKTTKIFFLPGYMYSLYFVCTLQKIQNIHTKIFFIENSKNYLQFCYPRWPYFGVLPLCFCFLSASFCIIGYTFCLYLFFFHWTLSW